MLERRRTGTGCVRRAHESNCHPRAQRIRDLEPPPEVELLEGAAVQAPKLEVAQRRICVPTSAESIAPGA